jgi:hypothetical protein
MFEMNLYNNTMGPGESDIGATRFATTLAA